MPKTKVDKTAEAITLLAEAIKGLETKIDSMNTRTTISQTVENITVEVDKDQTTSVEYDSLPEQYRQIVNERLSEKFGAKVSYRTDGRFEFSVSVPKEYTNVSPSSWNLNHGDTRLKVIENAMGEIGVREWCDLIAENLGHDIMLKVQDQRFATV
jgi:hypothetical protein